MAADLQQFALIGFGEAGSILEEDLAPVPPQRLRVPMLLGGKWAADSRR